jgi:multidrug resistance efflux pump
MVIGHELLDRGDSTLGSVKLLAKPPSFRTLGRWVVGVLATILLIAFLPWRQNIQGAGEVTALRPEDRPQQAVAAVGGRLAQWFVQEGDSVRAGDPLLALTEVKEQFLDPLALERLRTQLGATRRAVEEKRAKAAALGAQATALEAAWGLARQRAENRIAQLTATSRAAQLEDSIATVQAERTEALAADGLRSRADVEAARQRAQRARALATEQEAALNTAGVERAAVEADFAEKLAKVDGDRRATLAEVADSEGDVAKLATGVANLEGRQGLLVVRAPRDGIVVQVLRAGIGEVVRDGEAIATVQPGAPVLAVALQVTTRDVPLLRVGDPVRLEFAGWPAMQFSGWPSVAVGTFGGRVAVIDQVAQPSGGYRVLVEADPSEEAWPEELRMGSGARGWALLRRVSVGFEVWRLLNGFPPALPVSQPSGGEAPAK